MTLDISLEAIEADLAMAERGGQVATLALARAQVRATLLAASPADHQGRHEAEAGPRADLLPLPRPGMTDIVVANGEEGDSYAVPKAASWEDRVTAAAMLIGVEPDSLRYALQLQADARDGYPEGFDDPEPPTVLDEDELAAQPEEVASFEESTEPWPEDDVDADFFAEARKARKKK